MATTLATGIRSGEDSEKVAKEAVRQAKEKLGGRRVDLSMVYCASTYDYQNVVNVVRASTGKAPLIGCSTAGVFTEEEIGKGSIAVGLISSDDIKFFTAMAEGVKEDPERVVRSLANKLPGNVDGFPHLKSILLIDGLAGVGEEMTVLASQIFDQVFVGAVGLVGGTAGDDMQLKETFVFSDDNIATNAASICLLASKMPLFTSVKHGHTPLSGPLKITRAAGNTLYEVEGKLAWSVWKEETAQAAKKRGLDVEELKTDSEIGQFFANYGFGLATEKEGEYKIRWLSGVNEDGSLNFTCGIAEGSVFHIMDGSNLEDQINAAEEAARIARQSAENAGYSDFEGVLVFECAVRQWMLGDRFHESVDRFKKVLPDVPMLGWEAYGEIRLEPGQFSGYHNTTSVMLLLPRGDTLTRKKGVR